MKNASAGTTGEPVAATEVPVWNDATGPAELISTALALGTGLRFPRLVDGVPVEFRWDQPAPGEGMGARATWSIWAGDGGARKTGGHLGISTAVRAYREGLAFDAWWNRRSERARVAT